MINRTNFFRLNKKQCKKPESFYNKIINNYLAKTRQLFQVGQAATQDDSRHHLPHRDHHHLRRVQLGQARRKRISSHPGFAIFTVYTFYSGKKLIRHKNV